MSTTIRYEKDSPEGVSVVQCGAAGGGLDLEVTTSSGQVRMSKDEALRVSCAILAFYFNSPRLAAELAAVLLTVDY